MAKLKIKASRKPKTYQKFTWKILLNIKVFMAILNHDINKPD